MFLIQAKKVLTLNILTLCLWKKITFGFNLFWSGVMAVRYTVKILKVGTPKIITIIVLQLEQLDFTVQ